jgi:hypothetical protein
VILLIVPLCVFSTATGLSLFQGVRIYNAGTPLEPGNPDRTAIAYLDFNIENRSADGLFDIKVALEYDVQVNASRPAILSMLISGDRGAFAVPSANMADAGEDLLGNYRMLTYQYRSHNFPITEYSGWAFPWDSSSSPTIYFWANSTISPLFRVVSIPPQGFVWNLERIGFVSRQQLWEEMSLPDRLFQPLPPNDVSAFAFRITLLRDTLPFLASEFYAFSGIMIVWLAGGLARTSMPRREQRIPGLIGMAIAALAFSWSFHQIAPPSPTVVESFVVGIAMFWLILEALDVLGKNPKDATIRDQWGFE